MAEENYKRFLSEIRRVEEKQMHMMKKEFEKQKQESNEFRELSEAYSKREREQREHTERILKHERESNARKMEDMTRKYELMLEMNQRKAEQQLAAERKRFEVIKQEQEHIRRKDEIKHQHQQQRLENRGFLDRIFNS